MTRAEYIRSLSDEQLARFLCDLDDDTCDTCVATDYCYKNHIGLIDWLKEDISTTDYD